MNILVLDIETYPILGYTWGTYDQRVLAIKRPSIICAFSAKWVGGEQVTLTLPECNYSERQLLKVLWELLDVADIVVAHNGKRFDLPRIHTRFLKFKIKPCSPFKIVDTLRVAKRVFGFPSNKLGDLCEYLGIGSKLSHTGFSLWLGCMAKDPESWALMKSYNAQDVVILEKLYKRLLPWIDNHPNVSHGLGCPKCGSSKLQSRGTARSLTREYRRYQCTDCGGWSRSTQSTKAAIVTHV